MQKLLCWILLLVISLEQSVGYAQWDRDASDIAAGANLTIQGFITTPSASEMVPGYTTAPPETGYYANPNLSSAAQTRVTECAGSSDPSCQAVSTGIASAAAPKPALGQYDPDLVRSREIAANPGAILGDISSFYPGCTVTTVPTPAGSETRQCRRYVGLGRTSCSSKYVVSSSGEGTWENGCSALDSTNGYGSCTRVSGPTCIDGPSTKTVNGIPVYAACWEEESTFDCGSQAAVDECAQLESMGCRHTDSRCIKTLQSSPTICAVRQESYSCAKPAGTATVVSNCSNAACASRTAAVSPPVYDRQSCYTYLVRSLGQACAKSLSVNVTWSCPAGAVSGPTRDAAPVGQGTWSCVVQRTERYCPAPLTGPTLVLIPPSTTREVCTDPATGTTSTPSVRTVDTTVPAIPNESDVWANGCASFETRVPPGLLPPDGEPGPVGPATGPGVVNKCERATSACSIAGDTRVINDHPVTRACWGFANTFDCVENNTESDCQTQPPVGECTQLGDPQCIESDDFFDPPVCTAWRTDFHCRVRDATYGTVQDCGPEQPSADADFARTVAFLEAGREAGRYLDPDNLTVFNGAKNQCKKRLFGLTNCCKSAGTDSRSMFNNLSMANTATTAYKALFSTYTYDALFVADAPTWVVSAFEALAGGTTGFSSALAGVAAGDISFMSFLSSLSVFAWIAIILFIMEMAGLFDCPEDAQVTAMKRDANLCHDLGDYCSRRLPVVRTCVTRTRSFCCFNSRLARLINEQGRQQLGMPWGTARNPRCDGFSIPQLQSLNFAAMDLTEFYADIVPTMPNASSVIGGQIGRVNNCYFGQGKCQ